LGHPWAVADALLLWAVACLTLLKPHRSDSHRGRRDSGSRRLSRCTREA
jgi:hypothetical protein